MNDRALNDPESFLTDHFERLLSHEKKKTETNTGLNDDLNRNRYKNHRIPGNSSVFPVN